MLDMRLLKLSVNPLSLTIIIIHQCYYYYYCYDYGKKNIRMVRFDTMKRYAFLNDLREGQERTAV